MSKKILGLLLAAVMVITSCPFDVFAAKVMSRVDSNEDKEVWESDESIVVGNEIGSEPLDATVAGDVKKYAKNADSCDIDKNGAGITVDEEYPFCGLYNFYFKFTNEGIGFAPAREGYMWTYCTDHKKIVQLELTPEHSQGLAKDHSSCTAVSASDYPEGVTDVSYDGENWTISIKDLDKPDYSVWGDIKDLNYGEQNVILNFDGQCSLKDINGIFEGEEDAVLTVSRVEEVTLNSGIIVSEDILDAMHVNVNGGSLHTGLIEAKEGLGIDLTVKKGGEFSADSWQVIFDDQPIRLHLDSDVYVVHGSDSYASDLVISKSLPGHDYDYVHICGDRECSIMKRAKNYRSYFGEDAVSAGTFAAKQKYTFNSSDFETEAAIDKYTVSPKKVASITRDGVLTVKKAGTATVKAYVKNGRSYEQVGKTLSINVEKPIIKRPSTFTAKGQIVDGNELISGTSMLPVSWRSGNTAIVDVDESTGAITACGNGKTKIYAYFGDKGTTACYSAKVSVKGPALKGFTVKSGRQKKIRIVNTNISPSSWWSEDEDTAIVDEDGYVTGIEAGKTRIFAAIDGQEYSCWVTVKGGPKFTLNSSSKTAYQGGSLVVTPVWKNDTSLEGITSENVSLDADSDIEYELDELSGKIIISIGQAAKPGYYRLDVSKDVSDTKTVSASLKFYVAKDVAGVYIPAHNPRIYKSAGAVTINASAVPYAMKRVSTDEEEYYKRETLSKSVEYSIVSPDGGRPDDYIARNVTISSKGIVTIASGFIPSSDPSENMFAVLASVRPKNPSIERITNDISESVYEISSEPDSIDHLEVCEYFMSQWGEYTVDEALIKEADGSITCTDYEINDCEAHIVVFRNESAESYYRPFPDVENDDIETSPKAYTFTANGKSLEVNKYSGRLKLTGTYGRTMITATSTDGSNSKMSLTINVVRE